ncbi:DUF2334 domain-containing protein [Paenibacillus hamazuiensis]|uniref:DUF2334 domain-containing protein n=1 Tax=Paenibacillus hamazuiensis TaxID=2936508 RepID=UPI00200F6F25|nr:DUF2334 domain-containing protein [Paenibacillus hamazuiensis]
MLLLRRLAKGWYIGRRSRWMRYIAAMTTVSLLFTAVHIITVEGGSNMPKFVIMRLEDIGPGGQYGSVEQLGKLRAVLELLQKNNAAYHLAVIPRWIDYPADGSRYDVSLDQTNNPYVQAFDRLLQQSVQSGAVLGMHGYTHQVGSVRRDDGHHESGIGNEFNENNMEETTTAAFAYPRLQEGLRILEAAGFQPTFWEAPHYRSTAEQDAMFRNYFGLNYQAEVQAHRGAPAAFYMNERNTGYGVSTLGAAYVPTPFDYIAYNKDEKVILDRLGKSDNINSFFYHPFLEFKHLIPVTDSEGNPVIRDGLPEYVYPAQDKSNLQKLLAGLKAKGYRFYSIHDYVPFTPAHSVTVGSAKEAKLAVGDVTGDRQTDIVRWDTVTGDVTVTACDFKKRRNAEQTAPQRWTNIKYQSGAAMALSDTVTQGSRDLYVAQPDGRLLRYASDGSGFVFAQSWTIPPLSWGKLTVQTQPNGDVLLFGLSKDNMQLNGLLRSGNKIKPLKPFKFKTAAKTEPLSRRIDDRTMSVFVPREDDVTGLELTIDQAAMQWTARKAFLSIPNEDGDIRFGDFNGDGREDILRADITEMRYTVYLQEKNGEYRMLSTFGPWGKAGERLIAADFDGNGKTDLAVTGSGDPYLDIALSFESGS